MAGPAGDPARPPASRCRGRRRARAPGAVRRPADGVLGEACGLRRRAPSRARPTSCTCTARSLSATTSTPSLCVRGRRGAPPRPVRTGRTARGRDSGRRTRCPARTTRHVARRARAGRAPRGVRGEGTSTRPGPTSTSHPPTPRRRVGRGVLVRWGHVSSLSGGGARPMGAAPHLGRAGWAGVPCVCPATSRCSGRSA